MLDLNVLLDVVQQRQPFYASSARVLSRAIQQKLVALIPAHAVTTLYYLVAKHSGTAQAEALIDWILRFLEIVPQGKREFLRARALSFRDFEDAAVASGAEAAGCDFLVTRNVADFSNSPVRAVTPEEFLLEA